MQAVAGQVDRDRSGAAPGVHVHAQPRLVPLHRRAPPGALAELVHDGVLHPLRAEVRMDDAREFAGIIHGEGAGGIEVGQPVEAARALVELVGVRGREFRDAPQHPQTDPRPQAGAVGLRERRGAGGAARRLLRVRDAERGKLRGRQVRGAGRRRDEQRGLAHSPSPAAAADDPRPGSVSSSAPGTGRSRKPARMR